MKDVPPHRTARRPVPARPRAFLTRELPGPAARGLEQCCDLSVHRVDRPPTADEIAAGAGAAHLLVCTIADRIDGALLDRLPEVALVANYGVGFNHIDLPAATARGIAVTNTPGVLTEATADLAFALLLAAARRLGEGERLVRSGSWSGWAPTQLLGRPVSGAVLGLVGLGRIGRAMAKRAHGFGMEVRYWNRTRLEPAEEAAAGLIYRPLAELLAEADFVSLHVAYSPATHHLLGAENLARLKPGAVLVNTARGPVVDEAALVAALRSGHLAGAGLDVYEHEPRLHPGLLECPTAVLAPHLGSATTPTREAMSATVLANVEAFLRGDRPPNLLNPEVGSDQSTAPTESIVPPPSSVSPS